MRSIVEYAPRVSAAKVYSTEHGLSRKLLQTDKSNILRLLLIKSDNVDDSNTLQLKSPPQIMNE